MAIHDMEALQGRVTAAPVLRRDDEPTEAQICGYFNENENYSVYCGGTSTCSTPLGGKSWGCCDTDVCYVPATCEDAGAKYCGGTPSSRCTRTPIMHWLVPRACNPKQSVNIEKNSSTYGASSRCVAFVRQTASDDPSKLTSWGCQETTTTYIINPPLAARTGDSGSSATASDAASETISSTVTSDTSSIGNTDGHSAPSGLSTDGKIILGVLLPVLGIAGLIGLFLFLRRRNRVKPNGFGTSQTPQERGDARMVPEVKPPPSTAGGVHEVENIERQAEQEKQEKAFQSVSPLVQPQTVTGSRTHEMETGERPAELLGNERPVEVRPPENTPQAQTDGKVYEMGGN